jgi:alpha/beta superfamily hydrolase
LRFNFRGVGASEGSYSGFDEYRDVEAAAAYLRARLDAAEDGFGVIGRPPRPLALAGYSFGSIMAAMAAAGETPVQALALIAFVVSWEDLRPVVDRLAAFRGPVFALCGENDEISPPNEVEQALSKIKLDFSLSVVSGADHFFAGAQREVGERVAEFFAEAMSRDGGRGSLGQDPGVAY